MMTKMTSKRAFGIASALLATALIGPACLVRGQGVAERAGQALDGAGRGIRQGVQNAFSRTRASVHNQETISRVYSRVHWDKTLVGSTLELEVLGDGSTVILRGAVADAAAKQRAVLLARDTVGVGQVVDELTVAPPTAIVVPAQPTGTTTTTTTVIKP